MSQYKEKINHENVKLVWNFKVSDESCENPEHYEDYIRMSALCDLDNGLGVTYLYIDYDENLKVEKLMGYVTIRVTSLVKDVGEDKKYGYPAVEISQLAVDKDYARQNLGTDIVMDIITLANELNETISIKYIVLCADPYAEGFYKREPLKFQNMYSSIEDIPREHCNLTCIPMYIKLR